MSHQNAIHEEVDNKAISEAFVGSVIAKVLPALESALTATAFNYLSLQLTTLANSPTISKKDFSAINGISASVIEKWIANGVALPAPTPSSTLKQNRLCKNSHCINENQLHQNPDLRR